jgi:Uma2 family endonuclease
MSIGLEQAKRVWTEAELEALPDEGYRHEVVNGRLVMSPKNNFFHERICMRLSTAMNMFVNERRLGVVLGSSAGFWMHNRNCRAPDISFVPKERLDALGFKPSSRTFFPGAPDLAIEVLSPSNTPTEIQERLEDFFGSGTQLAWIVHPEEEFVEICHSPTHRRIIGAGAALDGEQLLPGFRFPIADLFKDWDWE